MHRAPQYINMDPTLRHETHASKDPVGRGGAWWRRHNGGGKDPTLQSYLPLSMML